MNADVEIILGRIEEHFKRVPNTRYVINVVNDKFDKTYNFFFFIGKKGKQPHSVPLHTVKKYDLEYLEKIIIELQKHYQLTLDYTGFTNQRWPNSWQIIQKKKKSTE